MLRRRLPLIAALTVGGCFALTALGIAFWSGLTWPRLQPRPASQELFPGIHYQRQVRQSPRLQVIHIVSVDLRTDGLRFLVTPGDPDAELPLKARTTTSFLQEFNLDLAVNGDGFTPWHSYHLLDYYPHSGDPVEPVGFAASQGTMYSAETDDEPVLYISRTNQARFNTPTGRIYNAISGNLMLVQDGQALSFPDDGPEPRSAVGLDKANRRLFIVVVDGRQPGYSEGASLDELAELFISLGAHTAMNLDGGGSSSLAAEGGLGGAELLNTPINHGIPGWQRPVANHLGVSVQTR